jgi:hypothetical protein
MVPLLASSKRPALSNRASVNAPRMWPNISLSNNEVEIPPRFTFIKGLLAARAVLVHGLGNQFLTRAAFAHDEDGCIGTGNAADGFQDLQHLRVFAYNVLKVVLLVQLLAGAAYLGFAPAGLSAFLPIAAGGRYPRAC